MSMAHSLICSGVILFLQPQNSDNVASCGISHADDVLLPQFVPILASVGKLPKKHRSLSSQIAICLFGE